MDSLNYSPSNHLNQIFDSPNSLNEIPDILSHINQYKLELKNDIEKSKSEYNCSTTVNDDIKELLSTIHQIKSDSKTTKESISLMTKSIQDLDTFKKNLVNSMTILKRLQMLINVNNDLNEKLESRNYKEIYSSLGVIKELLEFFRPYKSIDEINQINLLIIHTQNKLIDDIFMDFEDGKGNFYGAKTLELIDGKYKDNLLTWFFNQNLKDLKNIFGNSDEAGSLDNLNRRYIYFNKIFDQISFENFPKDWNVEQEFTNEFFKFTKQDISRLLYNSKISPRALLDNLQITQDFEKSINSKYNTNFNISSVFEPYLILWVNEQDSVLNQKLIQFNSVSQLPEELIKDIHANVPNVSNSSTELFKIFNKLFSQLLKLSKGEVLKDLAKLFNKYLYEYYSRILLPILQTESNNTEESIKYLTMVLNSSDYIIGNIDELSEKFETINQPYQFNKDIYFQLINRTITKLTNLDYSYCWREFNNFDWDNLEDVTDVSSYMQDIKKVTKENLKLILPLIIRDSYIRTFNDKLIDSLLTTILNLLRSINLSVVVCEQLLLDISNLKDLAFKFPSFGNKNSSTSYTKFVNIHFQDLEKILKLLIVPIKPMENIIESYFELIGDQSISNFTKILNLRKIENKSKFIDNFKLQLTIENEKRPLNQLLANLKEDVSSLSPPPSSGNKLNDNFKNFGKIFSKKN
ncbi:unnamed protein product [Candida verbasci]|uniref:Vps53 N-terminal domain-containing protein n=1 Tax=Candida verbasci TaxID=1227364 RepID=A0A9W4TXY3_9ASCO|nr:unnamed protein product [Candida verbasci]